MKAFLSFLLVTGLWFGLGIGSAVASPHLVGEIDYINNQAVEGEADYFYAKLSAQPTGTVVLRATSSDPAVMQVSPATLTFTPSNWNVFQTFTQTAVQDSVATGTRYAVLSVSVDASATSAPEYLGASGIQMTFYALDDEVTAGFFTYTTHDTFGAVEGGTDVLMARLTTQPTANVVLKVTTNDASVAAPVTQSVTFTPGNWYIPQAITVMATQNTVHDGARQATIKTAIDRAASAPEFYWVEPLYAAFYVSDDD